MALIQADSDSGAFFRHVDGWWSVWVLATGWLLEVVVVVDCRMESVDVQAQIRWLRGKGLVG